MHAMDMEASKTVNKKFIFRRDRISRPWYVTYDF